MIALNICNKLRLIDDYSVNLVFAVEFTSQII